MIHTASAVLLLVAEFFPYIVVAATTIREIQRTRNAVPSSPAERKMIAAMSVAVGAVASALAIAQPITEEGIARATM